MTVPLLSHVGRSPHGAETHYGNRTELFRGNQNLHVREQPDLDIGHAVQTYVESHGFGVVRAFVTTASAKRCTKEPESKLRFPRQRPAMVKCMTLGQSSRWSTEGKVRRTRPERTVTTVTADGKLAAHYENPRS